MIRIIPSGITLAKIVAALGYTPLSPTGNGSQLTGFSAVATSGSASDLSAGTLAAARGGAGTVNGIMKANGAGAVAAVTVGTGLSFDGTTLSSTAAGASFSSVASNTISGTPSSVVFTSVSSEDIIVDLSNVAITTGSAVSFRVEFSTNNGSSYFASTFELVRTLSTTGIYAMFPIYGLKVGRVFMPLAGNSAASSTSAPPQDVTPGTVSTKAFLAGSQVNALRFTPASSTFVNGGIITLYGRG